MAQKMKSLLIFIFFYVVVSFFCQSKHTLNMLICLEFLALSVFFILLSFFMGNVSSGVEYLMFFLVIGCCLSAVGLALVVYVARFPGSDAPTSLSTSF